MKKIAVVTGNRAEYGLLRWLMEGIKRSKSLELQLIVTGMHLSPEFGMTKKVILDDGFIVDREIEMLISSDTAVGVTKSVGLGVIGFADALAVLRPDMMLLLGDRYEIFAAASSAMIAGIPIAHLHGGESTEGSIDDAIRHSITKMSHLHFVAAAEYRKRVIQMGEHPDRVFNVGGLGIDNISRLNLLSRLALEEALGIRFASRNLLITFHPVTLESDASCAQLHELLVALEELDNTGLIFTMPNADVQGRALFQMIEEFCAGRQNAHVYASLGQLLYLSCMQHVDGVVGNSSSGLLEAPSLKTGVINIGDRQSGRLKAESVLDCQPERSSIRNALERLFSVEFQAMVPRVENPYGTGGASEAIVKILEEISLRGILRKGFYGRQ